MHNLMNGQTAENAIVTHEDDGSYETEVDFETIVELANLIEDDDDPEIS